MNFDMTTRPHAMLEVEEALEFLDCWHVLRFSTDACVDHHVCSSKQEARDYVYRYSDINSVEDDPTLYTIRIFKLIAATIEDLES